VKIVAEIGAEKSEGLEMNKSLIRKDKSEGKIQITRKTFEKLLKLGEEVNEVTRKSKF
jgi:hypothetical protein